MESQHFTRSKARRPSVSPEIASGVEHGNITSKSEESGTVRLSGTAAKELESVPQQLAEPPSAPATVEGRIGGSGSESSFLAGPPESLRRAGRPNDWTDVFHAGIRNAYTQLKQALSDSGVSGPPPDAAAVGERPTSSAARRPLMPRPRPTPENLTLLATFSLGPFLCLHLLLGTFYLNTFFLSTPYPPLNAT